MFAKFQLVNVEGGKILGRKTYVEGGTLFYVKFYLSKLKSLLCAGDGGSLPTLKETLMCSQHAHIVGYCALHNQF